MLILDEYNNILPEAETLVIPEFQKIWTTDNSKNKEEALKLLAYIYFKHDLKSKYRNTYSGKELEEEIKKDLFSNKDYILPDYLKDAEIIYEKLQPSKALKTLLAAESSLEVIKSYFNSFSIDTVEDERDKGDLISKLMKNLKEIDDVTLKIETAKKRIQEELFANSINKKRKLSKWETPN